MSWDNMTPEEMVAAQQQVDKYGARALEIVQGLLECYRDDDHHRGGQLCREIYAQPNLLLLVIGKLTSMVIEAATAPLVSSDEEESPALAGWEVSAADQMEAAATNNDLDAFAQIALDAQIRAYMIEMKRIVAAGGEPPDVRTISQTYLRMDRVAVIAIASESLRRLILQEAG